VSNVELIVCPLCRKIIHRHDAEPSTSRARVSSRVGNRESAALLSEMMEDMERAHRERIEAAEAACLLHYQSKHRLRIWLWHRLHWDGLMNKRWVFFGETSGEQFKYGTGS
jgi:hypothetical protein